MSMTGSMIEVRIASRARMLSRIERPIIVLVSRIAPRGRGEAAWITPAGAGATIVSDMGGLLVVLVVLRGRRRAVPGERQEHVVQSGAVDGEAHDGGSARVDL